jgi:hypothetical protein
MIENLKEALATAERSASKIEIEEIAQLIGYFPMGHKIRTCAEDCPRIKKVLPKFKPCKSETYALLYISSAMNFEDIVGTVADKIRKVVRP